MSNQTLSAQERTRRIAQYKAIAESTEKEACEADVLADTLETKVIPEGNTTVQENASLIANIEEEINTLEAEATTNHERQLREKIKDRRETLKRAKSQQEQWISEQKQYERNLKDNRAKAERLRDIVQAADRRASALEAEQSN